MEPYEGGEPYIFISYARKDWERVKPLLEALADAGWRFWYDAGIEAGADWLDALLEKVERCAVFCPLFSAAFSDSRYCFFETTWAYHKEKKVVPLCLDEPKEESFGGFYRLLRKLQYMPLYQYADAAEFAERLGREAAFASCKAPEWHKTGQIQWRLSADGVLTIAKREGMPERIHNASIPPYQLNPIDNCGATPWERSREKILSVAIEDNIDAIGDRAFEGCGNLTEARLGRGVTKIGVSAFYGCKSLTDIRIPDSVRAIGNWAFAFCENLKSVEIPAGTNVGYHAFFKKHTVVTRRAAPD
ncbi:MAG: leucine-rich repeat protein [Oscillibacter sp.]|nr:leucine-rich repeat protein [Oscillibacter sp.]